MGYGESVGTRALVETDNTRLYCEAKAQAGFVAEQFSDLKASELDDG